MRVRFLIELRTTASARKLCSLVLNASKRSALPAHIAAGAGAGVAPPLINYFKATNMYMYVVFLVASCSPSPGVSGVEISSPARVERHFPAARVLKREEM